MEILARFSRASRMATLALLAVTACNSGMVTPNQGVPGRANVAASPPCNSGFHVVPSYAKINRGFLASFTLWYTYDLYPCHSITVATNWKVYRKLGHLVCRKNCATTKFWNDRRGTYQIIAEPNHGATVVVY
jgi:hypothetical protein